YETAFGGGGGLSNPCSPATVTANSCLGTSLKLWIDGPNTEDYTWTWMPSGHVGDTLEITPDSEGYYTVTGVPLSPCLVGLITKTIIVRFTEGPQVGYVDPGPICGEFDL